MSTNETWLNMARRQYEADAARWSLTNRDPVVGSYDSNNAFEDYDTMLFKGVETQGKLALEYGCGPGRNLIRYKDRFLAIDGVDIAKTNLDKAVTNLLAHGVETYCLYHCDGQSIPVADATYDVVFSVICLEHIPCYDIRFSIFKDVFRVLKSGGFFCFQMGYGGRQPHQLTAEYYDNVFTASATNSAHDVTVRDPNQLREDLIDRIGFKTFDYDLRPVAPGNAHAQWIWVRAGKE